MVSEHFSWDEVVTTNTGLDNEIPEALKPNAIRLAESVLEPLRVFLGPLTVNSWYRSPAVNKAKGGVETSYHRLALAADVVPNGDVVKAFKMAVLHINGLPIDQIILEKGANGYWIHIGTNKGGVKPRRQAMTSHINKEGERVYLRYEV